MKKVLVVIPHFNKLNLLVKCIEKLKEQSFNDFEVLIVDNGSIDGSIQFINELVNSSKLYHSILLSENIGFAAAVNKGIKYSFDNNFEYTILLNNDAFVSSDFIKNLVFAMETRNAFAISSLMLSAKNKNLIDDFGDNYNIFGYAYQDLTGLDRSFATKNSKVFSACAEASIYDNKKLERVGLFDEEFFAYLEDLDLSFRAKLYGYSCENCKEAICYHLGSATSGDTKYNEFKVRMSARNNILLIYKNMPIIMLIINLFYIVIGFIAKQIYFIKKGFGIDYFFGIIEGFRDLKYVERFDFRKVSIFRLIKIEFEIILNSIEYIMQFLKRKLG